MLRLSSAVMSNGSSVCRLAVPQLLERNPAKILRRCQKIVKRMTVPQQLKAGAPRTPRLLCISPLMPSPGLVPVPGLCRITKGGRNDRWMHPQDALAQEMAKAGLPVPSTGEGWGRAMSALKAVWASKFNERAYLSMKKAGLPFMDVRMAVLVMQVVPADYAFVIHTVNPATNDAEEVYCELVKGMGETLVGGRCPGKAMAFRCRSRACEMFE